ncbi:synaptotagmin-like protein 2 isoform X2 [Macrotis lagotis]|uniref:synaptotagmin-like protein 2 isoform X2 n=1 Tax=Macrotis lagotis TaxID=92651 RepID=UPI003D68E754
MIDLSFLTEEEQDVIMKVLQRDAELKRTEEERVRHLPEKIKDDQQLKNMSGQWFYEAKSKRHRDKIHGADIIRASIRKKKLQTIEQSQNRAARVPKTWVNNVNKDMLLSSEQMGVMEEQEEDMGGQSDSRTVVSNPAPSMSDEAQENPGKTSLSTTKLRKNPFNNPMVPGNNVPFQIPNEPSENGRLGLSQTSQEGALLYSKENKSTPYFPEQRLEEPRPVAQGPADVSSEKPIPKARKLINKNKFNQLPNDNESLPKLRDRTDFLNKSNAPRGILKRNSSSSSTDSECFRSHHTLETRNKNLPAQLVIQEGNSEKDDSLEDESSHNPLEPLKHVRFSAVKEVSQGPELNHGRELGEFGLLESDIPPMSRMEDAGDLQEPGNKPLFSRYRQPAQQMSPASDSCQINENSPSPENPYDQKTHPQSEILTERQSFSEIPSSERMSKETSSKGLSLESELCKNPADKNFCVTDECTHWVEPESPGLSHAADHQQGKHLDFKALNAKTNFQYDQKDTKQRNATNSSISKVLYWFSRSSNPDPEESPFLHHEGKLSKGKIDSAYQNNTMDTENAIFQQASISMKGDIKPAETGPFWVKGDPLCFENKNSSIEIKKSDGVVLPKQAGKEKEQSSLPFKSHNQGSKSTIPIQDRVKKADYPSFSSEGESISSFFNDDGFRENESNFSSQRGLSIPCKEPDDLQQKPSHLSGTQEQREIYKNINDRISFWEGGRKTAKINAKMLHSSGDQVQVPARISWPMKSIDSSMKNLPGDQNENGQVIAKRVDLNKNGQASHAPVIYSSVNHEGFKSQAMKTSREYPSVDHPGKIPSFQSEYSKFPMTDNLQSKRDDMTFPISKPDSHGRNEACSHLKNGISSIAQPNPTFKVWTLKERMNENFPKQINSPQFQNLRNFWDVVTNSGNTNNNTHPGSENLSSDSQRNELDETEPTREKFATVGQDLLRQNKASVGEEIGEWDSKLTSHSLSHETTFPVTSPAKFIQLPRNVPSKENVDEHLDWWVPPKLKEEGYFSMKEVKESVIKTNVLPKQYQDTFNISLKKLLEAQPVGDTDSLRNGHFFENTRYLQETDLTDLEERSESPQQDSKISTTSILDSPKAQCKPFIHRPEKPLKKAPELPDSSSHIRSECVSTGTSSLSKQRRFFEKVMERSSNNSFYKSEGGIHLEGVRDASNNTVVPSKIKSSDHEISQKALLQEAPASSHSLCPTVNLKESFGEATKSFQEMSSFYPALQDQTKPTQKEISETIEKTVLPKTEFFDYHSTLEKFLRENQEETLNCTRKERVVSRKREPGFAEGVAVTHNQIISAVKMTGESGVPDDKSSQTNDMGLEEPKEEALGTFSVHCHDSPYLGQSLTQPGSTSNQQSKILPQEISEVITKNIIQSGASLREFNIGIDKLLKETSESSPLKMEIEEIQETIEKSLAPSVVESTFDLGLEKILKEVSGTLPIITEERGALSNKTSPPEQGKLSRKMPHLHSWNKEDAKVKVKSKVLKPQSQDPSESVPREKTCSIINKVLAPYTKEEEEERESSSGSDFSDGFVSSNTDSRRSSSCSEEESNPVLNAFERNADRKMPSQSLEDIPSETSNQGKVDFLPEDLVRSAEDDQKKDQEQATNECVSGISTVPSHPDNQFAIPEKLKRMSKSVPAILQDESDDRETDASSESGYQFGRYKKSMSSFTLSSSSGMTSLSSVSGSAVSIYSGDFGDLEIKGSIQFAIDYVDSLMELHVFVAQCKDLAAVDVKKQRSDPYVKTYLLPYKGKMGKKKTLVMKKTLNPVYNEILRYKIDKHSLKTQKLYLSVWHRDMFKHNRFLGEVELDLETWDWDNQQNKQLKWYLLNRRITPIVTEAEKRGEMRLALQYVPEPFSGKKLSKTGEVHIWVKECIDLPCLRGNHLNSFVKCIFLPDTSRKSRQKTKTIAKTTNPFFNHAIVYDGFTPEDLKEACAELTVWDHHRLRNQFLGGLRLGFGTGNSYGIEVDWMDSTPAEVSLWERMVNSPNTWVEDILPLRMLLIAKLTK